MFRVVRAYAHDAVVTMPADADVREPGAKITVALCGHWEHEGPCPLAPHHTSAVRAGDAVALRILFAAEADDETEVRARIRATLSARWELRSEGPSDVSPAEADHAARLVT